MASNNAGSSNLAINLRRLRNICEENCIANAISFLHRQFVKVPKMLNDTDTFPSRKYFRYRYQYFFGTKFFRFRDFFPIPNFNDTGSLTFFWYQNFSDTGSDTTRIMKNSRYRYLYGTGTHYKSSKFLNFGNNLYIFCSTCWYVNKVLVLQSQLKSKDITIRFRNNDS